MIGKLELTHAGRKCSATLDDDLHWHTSDQSFSRLLGDFFPAKSDGSVSKTDVGRHLLFQAGQRLGADVTLASHEGDDS